MRATWNTGDLLTNLSDGGSGREIFSGPLIGAVQRHVTNGWQKTHFLSFSASGERALAFAAGPDRDPRDLRTTDDDPWDAALITIDTTRFAKSTEIETGVYQCAYPGRIPVRADRRMARQPSAPLQLPEIARMMVNTPQAGRIVRVLLIDVVSSVAARVAAGEHGLGQALQNARRDEEWLVLPIDPFEERPGEFTSKLDDGCVSRFTRLRFG